MRRFQGKNFILLPLCCYCLVYFISHVLVTERDTDLKHSRQSRRSAIDSASDDIFHAKDLSGDVSNGIKDKIFEYRHKHLDRSIDSSPLTDLKFKGLRLQEQEYLWRRTARIIADEIIKQGSIDDVPRELRDIVAHLEDDGTHGNGKWRKGDGSAPSIASSFEDTPENINRNPYIAPKEGADGLQQNTVDEGFNADHGSAEQIHRSKLKTNDLDVIEIGNNADRRQDNSQDERTSKITAHGVDVLPKSRVSITAEGNDAIQGNYDVDEEENDGVHGRDDYINQNVDIVDKNANKNDDHSADTNYPEHNAPDYVQPREFDQLRDSAQDSERKSDTLNRAESPQVLGQIDSGLVSKRENGIENTVVEDAGINKQIKDDEQNLAIQRETVEENEEGGVVVLVPGKNKYSLDQDETLGTEGNGAKSGDVIKADEHYEVQMLPKVQERDEIVGSQNDESRVGFVAQEIESARVGGVKSVDNSEGNANVDGVVEFMVQGKDKVVSSQNGDDMHQQVIGSLEREEEIYKQETIEEDEANREDVVAKLPQAQEHNMVGSQKDNDKLAIESRMTEEENVKPEEMGKLDNKNRVAELSQVQDRDIVTESNDGEGKEPKKVEPERAKPLIEKLRWKRFIDPHTYPYLINPTDACISRSESRSNITLLVIVHTAPSNFGRRGIIRRTWMKAATSNNLSSKTLFLLGTTEIKELQYFITSEANRSGDIIQEDFVDSYLNLTLKTAMGLKWASTFCPNAEFVMKTDDDVILNIVSLTKDLSEAPLTARRNFLTGRKIQNAGPLRDTADKWYTPEALFPSGTYPPYPEGHGYIMSRDVVRALYRASTTRIPIFPWEDVFVGMLLQELHLDMIHLSAVSLNQCFRGYSNITKFSYGILKSAQTLRALQRSYFIYDLSRDEMDAVWSALETKRWPYVEEGGCSEAIMDQFKRLPDLWVK